MKLQRITVYLDSTDQWYNVIREANTWFGRNQWKSQNHVRRKLIRPKTGPISVWFDVPDLQFATWLGVKYSINAEVATNK